VYEPASGTSAPAPKARRFRPSLQQCVGGGTWRTTTCDRPTPHPRLELARTYLHSPAPDVDRRRSDEDGTPRALQLVGGAGGSGLAGLASDEGKGHTHILRKELSKQGIRAEQAAC